MSTERVQELLRCYAAIRCPERLFSPRSAARLRARLQAMRDGAPSDQEVRPGDRSVNHPDP